jgi:chloride channel protein, CIC family
MIPLGLTTISGSRFREELGYLNKWVPIAILIGLVAGAGAVIFAFLINAFTQLFLVMGAGYTPPYPAGEGSTSFTLSPIPFVIPLITCLGGLLAGLIVYKIAPEAEGHGTDAAIDAFHHKKGEIRPRVPFVKIIASAITIGSGGSAGREGPSAQIGAGFGSYLGKLLHLRTYDRRMALAIGIGAGIGAIFKTPFGGAILAAEILYLGDFETAILPPALIASTISYTVYASVYGWTPIFGTLNLSFYHDPVYFLLFAVLGILCGVIAIVYVRSFYGIKDIFHRWKIPNYFKPAIGGLLVGLIAIALPEVLGMGYGWLQLAINGDFATLTFIIILLLIPAKMIATSLTIGSGGSGGVFAPALFVGGMVGAAMWMVCNTLVPGFAWPSAPFVIVGMMAFFGAAGKAPVAVILMVAEMTASYVLLVPAMIATTIAYILSGKNTIYRSQVPSKADSPAHKGEYSVEVLRGIKVKDAMTRSVVTLSPKATMLDVEEIMKQRKIHGIPIVDPQSRVIGMVAYEDILRIPLIERKDKKVGEVMATDIIFAEPEETLSSILEKMFEYKIGRLPVVDSKENAILVGIITRKDIGNAYHASLEELFEE